MTSSRKDAKDAAKPLRDWEEATGVYPQTLPAPGGLVPPEHKFGSLPRGR